MLGRIKDGKLFSKTKTPALTSGRPGLSGAAKSRFLSKTRTRASALHRLVHIAHAAAVAAWHRSALLLFRDFRNQRFGGQHQAGDRSRVLQGSARDLGRVDDAGLD